MELKLNTVLAENTYNSYSASQEKIAIHSNYYRPHGVQDVAFLCDPQQFVWNCDGVDVRILAVVEIRVRTPYSL